MRTIEVKVEGAEPYPLSIAPGALEDLGSIVRGVAPHDRALLVIDANIVDSHGATAAQSLEGAGFGVTTIDLEAEESAKTLEAVRRLYDRALADRLERASPVVAVGGGIIGDTAGFAAASYLRGVPLVQVPTTLLAMVDAAIGGKTGVNIPLPTGGLGKNLIGAFWQPRAVIADPRTLATLDPRDLRCGLAECVKHALIADRGLLELIQAQAAGILSADEEVLTELIERSAGVKVGIVESDVREAGQRALLNLGHTFAHAIESIEGLGLRHGEAVSVGLCAAMHCAVETGRFPADEAAVVRDLLTRLELPVELPHPAQTASLVDAMAYDKKVVDGRLRLVLPLAIGRAEIADDVPSSVIESAWQFVGAAQERASRT